MKTKYLLITGLLASFSFLAAYYFLAPASVQWTGAADSDWNNAMNWSVVSGSPSLPPSGGSLGDDVIIPDVNNDPVINAMVMANARSMVIHSGAVVTVAIGGTLNVVGSGDDGVTNSGILINQGTLSIDSSYNHSLVNLTGGQVNNSGNFTLRNGFGSRVKNSSSITNTGTFNVLMGVDTGLINYAGAVIHNNGGNFIVDGGNTTRVSNRGTINNQANFQIGGGSGGSCFINFQTGIINNHAGTLQVSSGFKRRVDNYGQIYNSSIINIGGASTEEGLINRLNSTFQNVIAGSSLSISAGSGIQLDNYSTINNSGSINIAGGGGPTQFYNRTSGTLNNLSGSSFLINFGNGERLRNEHVINHYASSVFNIGSGAGAGLVNTLTGRFNLFAGSLTVLNCGNIRLHNQGEILLNGPASIGGGSGQCILNATGAKIQHTAGGIMAAGTNVAIFENEGTYHGSPGTALNLSSSDSHGLYNKGTFVDSSSCQIVVSYCGGNLIYNIGTLVNECVTQLTGTASDGIYNSGSFVHQTGSFQAGGFGQSFIDNDGYAILNVPFITTGNNGGPVFDNKDTLILGANIAIIKSFTGPIIANSGYMDCASNFNILNCGGPVVNNSGEFYFRPTTSIIAQNLGSSLANAPLVNTGKFVNEGQLVFRTFNTAVLHNTNLFHNKGSLKAANLSFIDQGIINTDSLINDGVIELDTLLNNGLYNQGVFVNNSNGSFYADFVRKNAINNTTTGLIENFGELWIARDTGVGEFGIYNRGDVINHNLINIGQTGPLFGGGINTASTFINKTFSEIFIHHVDTFGIRSFTDFHNESCAYIESEGIFDDQGQFINDGIIRKTIDTNMLASNVYTNNGLIINEDPDPFTVNNGTGTLFNGTYTPPDGSFYGITTQGTPYTFSCLSSLNVSLNHDCQVQITPEMLLTGNPLCPAYYQINLTYPRFTNQYLPADRVDDSHRGLELIYSIQDPVTQNKCWGKIRVEDKGAPDVDCANDTLTCFEINHLPTAEELAASVDNCEKYPVKVAIRSQRWIDYSCTNDTFAGKIIREIIASDVWKNTKTCTQEIWIERLLIDSLLCPDTVEIECIQLELVKRIISSSPEIPAAIKAKINYEALDPTTLLIINELVGSDDGTHLVPQVQTKFDGLAPLWTKDGPAEIGCNLVVKYTDEVFETCGASKKILRTWDIKDWCEDRDTVCRQWIIVRDTTPPQLDPFKLLGLVDDEETEPEDLLEDLFRKLLVVGETNAHDCKGMVYLPDLSSCILECGDFTMRYSIEYEDPTHPEKITVLEGTLPGQVYLPAGNYVAKVYLTDECWNGQEGWFGSFLGGLGGLFPGYYIQVLDVTPPQPVCDAHTQVTLDPDKCWAQVKAEDLSDGSYDQCCDHVWYAVAHMDSVAYYEAQFNEFLKYFTKENFGIEIGSIVELEDEFEIFGQNIRLIKIFLDILHEAWMNTCAFDLVEDLTGCGTDSLVVRVYKACDLPHYDPHVVKNITCFIPPLFNITEDSLFRWKIDSEQKFKTYWLLNKVWDEYFPLIGCITNESLIIRHALCLINYFKHKGMFVPLNEMTILEIQEELGGIINMDLEECFEGKIGEILTGLIVKEKYSFGQLLRSNYQDCMVEVNKADKTPPVCIPPADVTLYCDGVPYHWEVNKPYAGGTKNYVLKGWGADYAQHVCYEQDYLTTYCPEPFYYRSVFGIMEEGACCVEIPWDGGVHGYYGGPNNGHYQYRACLDYSWGLRDDFALEPLDKWYPIYCRIWLMLDQYDDGTGGKADVESYFGQPTVKDNCAETSVEHNDSGSLNECGAGVLTRTWTITDGCGNHQVCHQSVTVKARSDFEVCFPEDKILNCGQEDVTPEGNGGKPLISDDDCELIGISYEDEQFDVAEDGCYKIVRRWKIIDWCKYNPDAREHYPEVIVDDRQVAGADRTCVLRCLKDNGDGYMEYLQVIKVIDTQAPVLTCSPDITICNTSSTCVAETVSLELGHATDECTDEEKISYRYRISGHSGATVQQGIGQTFQGQLGHGVYQVQLVARDGCGNEDTCSYTVTVTDCKAPTPYCRSGVATVVMPSNGSVEVWAKDLNANSFDNCTSPELLKYSFDEAGEELSRILTCADIPNGRENKIAVRIYVHDEDGNKDYCETYILVQDGAGNVCTDVAGTLTNPVEDHLYITGKITSTAGKSSVADDAVEMREATSGAGIFLLQNRPNPFKEETVISWRMPVKAEAQIRIQDVTGRVLKTYGSTYAAGYHELKIKDLKYKGLLYYQLISGETVLTRKMISIE